MKITKVLFIALLFSAKILPAAEMEIRKTPLIDAIIKGRPLQEIKSLVKNNANLDERLHVPSPTCCGLNPLLTAYHTGRPNVLSFLFNIRDEVTIKEKIPESEMKQHRESSIYANLNKKDCLYMTSAPLCTQCKIKSPIATLYLSETNLPAKKILFLKNIEECYKRIKEKMNDIRKIQSSAKHPHITNLLIKCKKIFNSYYKLRNVIIQALSLGLNILEDPTEDRSISEKFQPDLISNINSLLSLLNAILKYDESNYDESNQDTLTKPIFRLLSMKIDLTLDIVDIAFVFYSSTLFERLTEMVNSERTNLTSPTSPENVFESTERETNVNRQTSYGGEQELDEHLRNLASGFF